VPCVTEEVNSARSGFWIVAHGGRAGHDRDSAAGSCIALLPLGKGATCASTGAGASVRGSSWREWCEPASLFSVFQFFRSI